MNESSPASVPGPLVPQFLLLLPVLESSLVGVPSVLVSWLLGALVQTTRTCCVLLKVQGLYEAPPKSKPIVLKEVFVDWFLTLSDPSRFKVRDVNRDVVGVSRVEQNLPE